MQARPMQRDDQPQLQLFVSSYGERLQRKIDLIVSGPLYYWQQDRNSHQLMPLCWTLDVLLHQNELEGVKP